MDSQYLISRREAEERHHFEGVSLTSSMTAFGRKRPSKVRDLTKLHVRYAPGKRPLE
jgi:hypothetical protein